MTAITPQGDSVDEALAERAAIRFRERHLPFQLEYEKDAFAAAGGTDAGQAVLAELRMRSFVSSRRSAIVIAEELVIDLDTMQPDERVAAIDKVEAEDPDLVARVTELCRAYPASGADEQLAQLIAAQAPIRVRAQAQAARDQVDARLRASLSHPNALAAFELARTNRSDETLPRATRRAWAFCLAELAAPELGIPDSYSAQLTEHPAVQRALALVGAISTATPEEIETHRPRLELTPAAEQTAHRIAARAERQLRVSLTKTFQEGRPERRPDQIVEDIEKALADRNARLWHPAIELAAIAEPGISAGDPVALRAQELIPGLPTHYDRLISEQAMTPEQAAREYEQSVRLHAQLVAAAAPGLPGEPHPLPPDPPISMKPSYLAARHLGGHPALRAGQKRLWLYVSGGPAVGVYGDPRATREIATLEWSRVRSLQVEGPETAGSRVTLPRLAAGGLFAFAFKKDVKRAYLVFQTHAGSDVIFEVPGRGFWELKAELSPLVKWLNGETTGTPSSSTPDNG